MMTYDDDDDDDNNNNNNTNIHTYIYIYIQWHGQVLWRPGRVSTMIAPKENYEI